MKQFGTIACSQKSILDDYITVTYLRTRDTDALKGVRSLWIDDHVQLVIHSSRDSFWTDTSRGHKQEFEWTHPLSLAPATDSSANILNALDDNCVLYIFEMCLEMDPFGLCEMSRVCRRFKSITEQISREKFQSFSVCSYINRGPLWLVEDFYRIFGPRIIDVSYEAWDIPDVLIGIVEEYCPNLESFKCSIKHQQSCKKIQQLAQRIKSLHIDWVNYDTFDLSGILDCPNLEALTIDNRKNQKHCLLPSTKLPKLVDLCLVGTPFVDHVMYERFFEQNDQLETLTLSLIQDISFGVEKILNLLPNLRTLIIDDWFDAFQCDDFSCFGRLGSLKALDIASGAGIIDESRILNAIADNNIELEKLHCRLPRVGAGIVVDNVCRIKSLKCLELTCFENKADLWDFAQRLPRLTEFKVCMEDAARAVKFLRHTNNGLDKVSFVFVCKDHMVGCMDLELKTIWTMAKQRGFHLTVDVLPGLQKTPVSFTALEFYFLVC